MKYQVAGKENHNPSNLTSIFLSFEPNCVCLSHDKQTNKVLCKQAAEQEQRTSAFPLNWPEPASLTDISLCKCEG